MHGLARVWTALPPVERRECVRNVAVSETLFQSKERARIVFVSNERGGLGKDGGQGEECILSKKRIFVSKEKPVIKFSLPSKVTSLPTKCILSTTVIGPLQPWGPAGRRRLREDEHILFQSFFTFWSIFPRLLSLFSHMFFPHVFFPT